MKLLKEISEKSLGISDKEILEQTYRFRKSARAVLLNENNEVALQYVSKWDYYKLPGGGVELGETEIESLKREIQEEVGCNIDIETNLGIVIEYRNQQSLLHISYGYICRLKGEIGNPQYEQGELDDGYKTVWMSLEEALTHMQDKNITEPYQARSIIARERVFLEEATALLNK